MMLLTWERVRYGRKVYSDCPVPGTGISTLSCEPLPLSLRLSTCKLVAGTSAGVFYMACVGSTPASSALTDKLSCLLTPTGGLWTRLGSTPKTKEKNTKKVDHRPSGAEEDDSELQRAWGALIKEKEQSRQKKSRLDSLPSLQIEVSRESSSGSEAES